MKSFYGCRGSRLFKRRTLIIGAGSDGCNNAQVFDKYSDGRYQIMGFLDDNPDKQGTVIKIDPSDTSGYKVLGNRHTPPELIAQYRITTLILAISHKLYNELLRILMDCLELGV